MILNVKADPKIHLILGRPFIKIVRMLMDMYEGVVNVRIKDHEVNYKVIGVT